MTFKTRFQIGEGKIDNYRFKFTFQKNGLKYSVRVPDNEKNSIMNFESFQLNMYHKLSNFLCWEKIDNNTFLVTITVPEDHVTCHDLFRQRVQIEYDSRVINTHIDEHFSVENHINNIPYGYVRCIFSIDHRFQECLMTWKNLEISSHIFEYNLMNLYNHVWFGNVCECSRILVGRTIDLVNFDDIQSLAEWRRIVLLSPFVEYQKMVIDILQNRNKITWKILIHVHQRNFRRYARNQQLTFKNINDIREILQCRRELQQMIEHHAANNEFVLLHDCERKLNSLNRILTGGRCERDNDM